MKMISESAMRRAFPGWTCGCPDYMASRIWHVVYGPDGEGLYSMPQCGTHVPSHLLRDGDVVAALPSGILEGRKG